MIRGTGCGEEHVRGGARDLRSVDGPGRVGGPVAQGRAIADGPDVFGTCKAALPVSLGKLGGGGDVDEDGVGVHTDAVHGEVGDVVIVAHRVARSIESARSGRHDVVAAIGVGESSEAEDIHADGPRGRSSIGRIHHDAAAADFPTDGRAIREGEVLNRQRASRSVGKLEAAAGRDIHIRGVEKRRGFSHPHGARSHGDSAGEGVGAAQDQSAGPRLRQPRPSVDLADIAKSSSQEVQGVDRIGAVPQRVAHEVQRAAVEIDRGVADAAEVENTGPGHQRAAREAQRALGGAGIRLTAKGEPAGADSEAAAADGQIGTSLPRSSRRLLGHEHAVGRERSAVEHDLAARATIQTGIALADDQQIRTDIGFMARKVEGSIRRRAGAGAVGAADGDVDRSATAAREFEGPRTPRRG